MSLDPIKYISISRTLDQKILVEHIPDKTNKGFANEVYSFGFQFNEISKKVLEEQIKSSSSAKYSFNISQGKVHVLKDSNGFVFLGILYLSISTCSNLL